MPFVWRESKMEFSVWDYIISFVVGGFLCMLGQILVVRTKITTSRILVLYLVIGVILETLGIYQPFREFAKAGATVPIIGFGSTLAKGAIMGLRESGLIGLLSGGLESVAGGIAAAVFFAFVFAIIFNSHTKKGK